MHARLVTAYELAKFGLVLRVICVVQLLDGMPLGSEGLGSGSCMLEQCVFVQVYAEGRVIHKMGSGACTPRVHGERRNSLTVGFRRAYVCQVQPTAVVGSRLMVLFFAIYRRANRSRGSLRGNSEHRIDIDPEMNMVACRMAMGPCALLKDNAKRCGNPS